MLEKSKQKLNLDLSYPTIQNIRCVQNDIGSRYITIIISDNSKFYEIKDNYSVVFRQLKPDGNFIEHHDVFTINNGVLTMTLPEQSCTCSGISKCQIVISENNELIHTLKFNLIVEESILDDDLVESKTESTILDKMNLHLIDKTVHITDEEKNKLSDAINITSTITTTSVRENLTTGEKLSLSLGKIKKWFSDLKSVAFSGSYNDLSDKPTIPTKTSQLTNDSGYKTTDNNTTYTLTQDVNDGHKITLTPSTGTATTITIPDNNTIYDVATTSSNGLMTSAMVSKLNGVADGANKTAIDSSLSSTSINPVQNKVVYEKIKNLTTIRNTAVQVNIDFNDVVAPGLFQYAFYCNTEERHAPELNTTFYVYNLCRDSNNMEQFALAEGKNKLYYRTRTTGTWSEWAKLLTNEHIVNNFVTTDPTMIAAAPLVKQLKEKLDVINSRLITTGNTFCEDLDSLFGDGVKVANYSTDTLNRPSNYGVCLSVSHYMENVSSNQWSNQLAFSTTGGVYYRYKTGSGTWSGWVKLSTSDEITNISTQLTKQDIGNQYLLTGLNTPGWYRVAKFDVNNTNIAMGSSGEILELSILRSFAHNNNEVHKVRMLRVFQKSKISLVDSLSNVKLITKVRNTVGGNESYLEIYYTGTESNNVSFILECGKLAWGNWELITPTKTEESLSNFSVYSTLDL